MKKILLEIYAEIHEETGTPVINWEFKEEIKAWTMVGVLETIKKELLDEVDFQSQEQLGGLE